MRWFWLPIAVLLAGCGDQLRTVAPPGALGLPDGCLDFGVVPPGSSSELAVPLANEGRGKLVLHEVSSASTHFAVPHGLPVASLEPGEQAELTVRFAPVQPGTFTSSVRIRSSDPAGRDRDVCVRGIGGGPRVLCAAERIDFADVPVGMSRTAQIACRNEGWGDTYGVLFAERPVAISGDLQARVIDDDGSRGPRDTGYAPSDAFTLELTFAPDEAGDRGGVIELRTNDPVRPVLAIAADGRGTADPPCVLEMPEEIDFGDVDVDQRVVRVIELRNAGESACTIWDVRLAPGGAPSFQITGHDRVVLPAGENLELALAFWPRTALRLHEAEISLVISDPASPERSIPVRGSSQRACLTFVPEALSFGEVAPLCATSRREIRLVNECDEPVLVEELRRPAAPFSVTELRDSPFELRPFESLPLEIHLVPDAPGVVQSRLLARAHGGDTEVQADLTADAVEEPVLRDTFTQRSHHRVDLLWVIDNSASMQPYQGVLAQGLQSFLDYALEQGIDFQVGVTTTGLLPSDNPSLCPGGVAGAEDGRLFPVDGSSPRILTRLTPDLADHWASNVNVGICNGLEQGLEAARRALTAPVIDAEDDPRHEEPADGNAGFLRRNTHLAVVFLTDEEDQSGFQVKEYFDVLASVKGASRPDLFSAHAIAGDPVTGCTGRRGLARPGDRYAGLVLRTGGVLESVCQDDWTEPLQRIGGAAFGLQVRFPLSNACSDRNGNGQITDTDGEVEVRVADQPIPSRDGQGRTAWTYDRIENAIRFFWPHVPPRGELIVVTCTPACGR